MGSTVLRVKLATAPLHLSLTFSYTNILGILFYSLVRVIICLCFLLSSRLFYFVHTLFCIYCLWWLQWSLMLPGAIGTEPYNKPHTPHSHRNRYRWATRTPSLRCDIWTGPSTYIWLCSDYGCHLSLGHSGTDPTRPDDLRQKWCRFWGQSPAGEQHQKEHCG